MSARESASTREDLILRQVFYCLILAAGMKDMHLDKCGAVSVFTAFQYVVAEKLPINLTASVGFV